MDEKNGQFGGGKSPIETTEEEQELLRSLPGQRGAVVVVGHYALAVRLDPIL